MGKRGKLLFLIGIGVILLIFVAAQANIRNNDENNYLNLSNDRIPSSPIYIDDLDPNFNWSKTAKENVWCSGSGKWDDPYIIRDLIIEAPALNNCIEIKNSNVPFIIQNCELFPAPQNYYGNGIKLENVNNSKILENDIHTFEGENVGAISSWISSNNNTILRNVIYDNVNSIFFTDGEKNNFSENKITNSLRFSIYLMGGKNNYICKNNITELSYSNVVGAIHLGWTSENVVKDNIVTASFYSGIMLQNSVRNNLTKNIVKDNQGYGIYLSGSDQNILLKNRIEENEDTPLLLSDSNNNSILKNHIVGYDRCIEEVNSNNNILAGNSRYWLDLPRISIDDTDPSKDWAYTAINYEWCSGWGTSDSPYIIENITINGLNSGNCIEIINSYRKFEIRNSNFFNSGPFATRAGITLTNSSQGKILNCNFYNHKGYGIYQSNSDHNVIRGNSFTNNENGIGASYCNTIIINNNTANYNIWAGILIEWSIDITLEENGVSYNEIFGIILNNTDNNKLMGNTLIGNEWNGVFLKNVNNSLISGNEIKNSTAGLSVRKSYRLSIWQNTLKYNLNGGLILYESIEADISGNNFDENEEIGIFLGNSDYCKITGNTMNSNYHGFYLENVHFSIIADNIISLSKGYGILLYDDVISNIIEDNQIVNNNEGLVIQGNSFSNQIYKNTLVGNQINAVDNSVKPTISKKLEWYRTWGSFLALDVSNDLALDSFGNAYVVGYSDASLTIGTPTDLTLNKFDYLGNHLWSLSLNRISSDYGISIGLDELNNIYVVGYTIDDLTGDSNIILFKYNDLGEQEWNQTWGSTGNEYASDCSIDYEGNIYITGSIGNDLLLLKYNKNGELLWSKTYGGSGRQGAKKITISRSTGEVYVTGNGINQSTGDLETFIIKYDQNGNQVWEKFIDTIYIEGVDGLHVDKSENIYITGYVSVGSQGYINMAILKFDSSGSFIWNITCSIVNYSSGIDLTSDIFGNLYVLGYGSNDPYYDIILLKYDSMGNILWNLTWGGSGLDLGYGLEFDSFQNLYICGVYDAYGPGTYGDQLLLKILNFLPNYWNNNFWDDYTGEDLNDDGIGDIPYLIPGSAGSIDNYPLFSDKEELFMDIVPHFIDGYTGDNLNFTIELTDYFGNDVDLLMDVVEEKAYWNAHSSIRTHFNSFTNYSGTLFHNETGIPSYASLTDLSLLNFTMYPYGSLMVAPEILEYNPITQYSRQRIELYFQLDLEELLTRYNLELKDISYLNATLFGAHFLELDYISTLIESFGKIEIYNHFTDSYFTLSDYIFDQSLQLGSINNLLKLENITDFSFGFIADELSKYVDINNMITFRFSSYFEGYLNNPGESYLSNFQANSVLGTLLDYISFDVVWWDETPEKVHYTETYPVYSNTIYTYYPTCPGTYSITFKVRPSANYKTIEKTYTFDVKRRPINITLDLPPQAYTTEHLEILANITDYLTNSPAINAKVNFYSNYSGIVTLLGSSVSDAYGIASIIINNLFAGNHLIFAEVEENYGRYSEPYKDEPFEKDIWAHALSTMFPIQIDLAPTSLKLLSLAPEGYNIIVGKNFYVYPQFIDKFTGLEIYNEEIEVYINSTLIGLFNSSIPFLMNFDKPGEQIVHCFFYGSGLYENIETTTIFDAKRLDLSIIDISPDESIYFPNQDINITVLAMDLVTNSPIEGLNIMLFNNITGLTTSGVTKLDGTVTFTLILPYDWASEIVSFYAINSPVVDMYLRRKTSEVAITIRPFSTKILFNINATDLYIGEGYALSFELWNLDIQDFVDDEPIYVTIYEEYPGDLPGYTNLELITSYNNSLDCQFLRAGLYNIEVSYFGSDFYLSIFSQFTFEVLKRPTYIRIDITDMELVPGNNFSITVYLMDVFTDELLLNKYINVYENIYNNGTLVVSKDPFEINTQFTNTFGWQPLREADFEFLFSFEIDDEIYQNSSYSILLSVKKRQIWIDSYIQSYTYKIGELININATFFDLNTTHIDVIPDLLVHYLILEGQNIVYSENYTSNEDGVIDFNWQIPSDLINKTLSILITTAETNYFQSTFKEYEISTSPLETYFNITFQPNPHGYINEEITYEVELLSIRGDRIDEEINYEIICEEISYYESGYVNLGEVSTLSETFSEAGKYIINFYYLGSDIYATTETEIVYYIELFPSELNLIDYPEILYSVDQTINLTYQLIDAITLEPMSGIPVKLFYIDIASSTKVYLDLEIATDLEGKTNFIAALPDTYEDSSVIFIAEANQTISHQSASNSVEVFISASPTSINFATPIDTYQYYINDNLNITFELYDYLGTLLIVESLFVEIETPTEYLTFVISCNQTIQLNFTEFGLYRVNASYQGSSFYLPAQTQFYYGVSPIPTSLEILETIPSISYFDQQLLLIARLQNNITKTPLVGELVKVFFANDTSTFLLYEGLTDEGGLISYLWDIDRAFIGQKLDIFAVYDYVNYFENSSTPKTSTYISKYEIDLQLTEIPDLLTPFEEEHFILIAEKAVIPSVVAQNCHIQIRLLLPNGTGYLIYDGFTDNSGVLEFDWIPFKDIFNFNEANFEIYVIGDDQYYGGLISSKEILIDKLTTSISIIPEETQVIPGEFISIDFALFNIYGSELYGQVIDIEIKNPSYSTSFKIVIGFNDTYEFLIPNYGTYEINGFYEGNERYYSSTKSEILYSEKFEIQIIISVLEAFNKNKTVDYCGMQWNYSVLDYNQNFTLIANVTIKDSNIPIQGIEVFFYFQHPLQDRILLGSNITDDEGIAIFKWNTSNFETPNWWQSSVLIANAEETDYNFKAESDPIYISLRKIFTFISLDTVTSKFRINAPYKIEISLLDEFFNILEGQNITIWIYKPNGELAANYDLVTNKTTHIFFTPTDLGFYKIKIDFLGTELYRGRTKIRYYECIEKEPTTLTILVPERIQPGQSYNIEIQLYNSTMDSLVGELVKVRIMYHNDFGSTEYYDVDVFIAVNSTFEWIFPNSNEYIIKATYSGSDYNKGTQGVKYSYRLVIFKFSFWEIIFFLFMPGIMLTPSIKVKTSKGKRRKKIFAAIFLALIILVSSYSGIAFICSQIETTGLIQDLSGISNYNPTASENQGQNTLNDLVEFGASKLDNLDTEWVPNLENDTAPYDLVTENSTIIPPEFDEIPPELSFIGIPLGASLQGRVTIKVMAFDKESGVQVVLFKLFHMGINLVEESVFTYDPNSDLYVYNLSTSNYDDGEYDIFATAIDNNNNNYTNSIEIKISNNPVYDVSDEEFDFVTAELTDYVNVSFISSVSGSYALRVVNQNFKTITTVSGKISANIFNTLEISINPLLFKAGAYKILITVFMTNILGFVKSETQELNLNVLKESVKLELDVLEGNDIYSNHYINFRARLIESDGYITDTGELIESNPKTPISGQVLSFRIGDNDNQKILGTVVTDVNGYAIFNYYVSLSKGQHVFVVKYHGNNIYQSFEETKLFENKGVFTDIKLTYVSTPVHYNEIATIKARLYADESVIPYQTLYFNISNSLMSTYIGMTMTDSNGEATIMFPCDYSPGNYSVIVSYDGKSKYANNVSFFENRLEIIRQNVDLSVETGDGSTIYCPYYVNTTIVAKILVENTDIAIEGINLVFELISIPADTRHQIGTAITDSNGLASIVFNPSSINNLNPSTYSLNVYSSSNEFYFGDFDLSDIVISEDIPIISIQGTEAPFFTEFQIHAILADSQLQPIFGELLHFSILNSSTGESLYETVVITDSDGEASIFVKPEDFPYFGSFDILVFYGGNNIYSYTQSVVKYGLQINYHRTQVLIQGPEKGSVIDPYEIKITLIDSQGTPITDQKILIECYKEGGITNLLKPNTFVTTYSVYGNATYSLNLIIPGNFIVKVYYLPLSDEDPTNDGFLQSQNELMFIIERAAADLSINNVNLARIMRGDQLLFAVEAGLKEAKREIIPINIFVDIDLNGDGIKHDDIFSGKYSYIKNGRAIISYNVPLDKTFQAGQYKFTVEIDEEWSSFRGNTTLLIDFVERTSLEIRYHILNPRTEGKHYVWEKENIEFILLDEDNEPLPATSLIQNGSLYTINRAIHYQIVNGKNIDGTIEAGLEFGNSTLEHRPTIFGFETCSIFYEGDRFFIPSTSRQIVEIIRRPLVLTFLDFYHNNPDRLEVSHTGHRGEQITILARVQDYLNKSYLENQIIQFGHDGRFLDISNRSIENGWAYIVVDLDEKNNLIQAGDYHLSLLISENDHYQSIMASHLIPLHIFEIGHININIGDISMEDMKYIIKPTLLFFDEDNQVLHNIEFFIQLAEKTSGKVVYESSMTSGSIEIPVWDAGTYEIVVVIANNSVSASSDVDEIASYFKLKYYVVLLTESEVKIEDTYIVPLLIPLISDSLTYALQLSTSWDAHIVTYTILLVINIFSGSLGQTIRVTWGTLVKLVLLSLFCGMLPKMKYYLFGIISRVGLEIGLTLVVGKLNDPDWLLSAVGFIMGGLSALLAVFVNRPERAEKRAKKQGVQLQKSLDFNIILLELGILGLAGIIEYIFSFAKGALGLLGSFVGAIPYNLWLGYHNFYALVKVLSFVSLLSLIIINAFISLVLDLIWIFVPKVEGFWGFISDLLRYLLRISLTFLVFVLYSTFFGFTTATFGFFVKQLVKSIFTDFILGAIIQVFMNSYQFTSVFKHTTLPKFRIK